MKRGVDARVLVAAGALGLAAWGAGRALAAEPEPLNPMGEAKGVFPGRVVWVHDPDATDWKGPGDGHWWEANHTSQERVNAMMSRALRELTGARTDAQAWDKLFRYFNKARGKGDRGYQPGEKLAVKPNWVGFIYREGNVNEETYTLVRRADYMNTSPQMLLALLGQLVKNVGVKESDITICDSLANLVNEYYDLLHGAYPNVQYVDHAGKFGRLQVKPSTVALYWSSRPEGRTPDYVPTCFAEAAYVINFANLKAHAAAGVTLCGKNHFGSLVRWPAQQGYYDIHPSSFSKEQKVYRVNVDLLGHAHLGGKTVLNLIDGLYPGVHPIDPAPRKWNSPPFNGDWASSLLVSQDPVAIDSVGFDFLYSEWTDFPRKPGTDDYLHEAALANDPPSGTFYDPDHPTNVKRLPSLGVHEHWNNPQAKKYSRNLGKDKGIELVAVELGGRPAAAK